MSGKTIAKSLEECCLEDRILLTLYLADRRGYGMCPVHISKMLIYGEEEEEQARMILSSMPLVSHQDFYKEVLEKNSWLETYFPQIYNGSSFEATVKKTFIARVLRLIYSNPVVSYLGERMCSEISSFLWRLVQFSRRNNPEALSGVRWVTEMQKPYALFGDRI